MGSGVVQEMETQQVPPQQNHGHEVQASSHHVLLWLSVPTLECIHAAMRNVHASPLPSVVIGVHIQPVFMLPAPVFKLLTCDIIVTS